MKKIIAALDGLSQSTIGTAIMPGKRDQVKDNDVHLPADMLIRTVACPLFIAHNK